jgi:hypothetical protein
LGQAPLLPESAGSEGTIASNAYIFYATHTRKPLKLDGQPLARLMVDYAPQLRLEGIGIMTLKLRQQNKQRVMDHSFRILRKAYKIIAVRQLVSNRSEVTLFLRRKG